VIADLDMDLNGVDSALHRAVHQRTGIQISWHAKHRNIDIEIYVVPKHRNIDIEIYVLGFRLL
jgi:hypothetical protein